MLCSNFNILDYKYNSYYRHSELFNCVILKRLDRHSRAARLGGGGGSLFQFTNETELNGHINTGLQLQIILNDLISLYAYQVIVFTVIY